ncbi:hypothetical protein ACWEFL_23730 [Streptomyces sp. NPDC004838]
MNDAVHPSLQALPDGEAELRLVVRLPWEDMAPLGQEAGRLAARLQRPVSPDEAVGHRLRTRKAGHAGPTGQQGVPSPVLSALTGRTPGEHVRQAMDRINGTAPAGTPHPTRTSA